MDGLVLVLWPGIRARAYLQCVLAAGLTPADVVLLGSAEDDETGQGWGDPPVADFDPGLCLRATLATHAIEPSTVTDLDLTRPALADAVRRTNPRWAVFTGGGIVPTSLLAASPHWIHVHPGRLPDWRGSTCLHYGLILEERTAATAFFLEAGLDRGRMLAHRHFEPNARWTPQSLDHAADAWMRAVVLVDALRELERCPELHGEAQPSASGQSFYVIHPVLKHLALQCAGVVAEERVRSLELSREDASCRS